MGRKARLKGRRVAGRAKAGNSAELGESANVHRQLSRLRALSERAHLSIEPRVLAAIAVAMAEGQDRDPLVPGAVYERLAAPNRQSRRGRGVFYTPAHLVDFVVEQTVGRTLSRLSAAAALQLRVLDPACGGGMFLLAALERIERHCRGNVGLRGRELRRAITRRCLVGIDLDPGAAAICQLALLLAADSPGTIAVGNALSINRPPGGGGGAAQFDVVLGNPPWGQKGFCFSPGEAEDYRRRYRTGRGVLDPFKLFVERAHEWVRVGGRWGMVLPDIILLKDQQPVRDLILAETELEWIADAGRAFAGVNLDAVVITGRRASARPRAGHRVAIWHSLPPTWRTAPPPQRSLPQAVFAALEGHKFNIHLDRDKLRLLGRLRHLPRLGEGFEVHEGVHSGNVRGKLFLTRKVNGSCRPLIVGRDEIARFSLRWAGRWVNLAPGVIDKGAGEYANLGRPAWHLCPKILVRRTGDHIIAARDARGSYYCSNNVFLLLPRWDGDRELMAAYVALLNSRFITWYFRCVQPRTGRLFAELKIHHLAAFPVPPGVAGLAAIAAALEKCRGRSRALLAELDERVETLFGLTSAERKVVHGAAP